MNPFFFPKKFWDNLYNILYKLLSNLLESVKTLKKRTNEHE